MVASTLRSLAWNCWVFDEHLELPQKTRSSLLTYRLRPFYGKAPLLSPAARGLTLQLRAERGHGIVFTSAAVSLPLEINSLCPARWSSAH